MSYMVLLGNSDADLQASLIMALSPYVTNLQLPHLNSDFWNSNIPLLISFVLSVSLSSQDSCNLIDTSILNHFYTELIYSPLAFHEFEQSQVESKAKSQSQSQTQSTTTSLPASKPEVNKQVQILYIS